MTITSGAVNREAEGYGVHRMTAMDSSASDSGSSSTDPATISSNDFLTLLVTEMQNQDPTADTDPNEYINQLVNVNSLEQLISINQTLTTALGTPSGATTPSGSTTSDPSARNAITSGSNSHPAITGSSSNLRAARSSDIPHVPGNLGIPVANASAQRVAKSLGGA
jgi:flagellar basal-body rod modification protein FlgD